MSIERRIEKLEERDDISLGEPSFTLYVAVGSKPTEEAIENAKKGAVAKRPGRGGYLLYFDEDGVWRG